MQSILDPKLRYIIIMWIESFFIESELLYYLRQSIAIIIPIEQLLQKSSGWLQLDLIMLCAQLYPALGALRIIGVLQYIFR